MLHEGHDENIGLVGPVSNAVSGRQCVNVSYREAQAEDISQFARQRGTEFCGKYVTTDRLVGFCLLFRRSIVDDIGGLDERFGIGNFEDDDLCLRARRAGYKAAIALDCFIHHFGHVSFRGNGVDLNELLLQNQQIFRDKWESPMAETQAPRCWKVVPAQGRGLKLSREQRTLSLCMIMRDNAHILESCLGSIKPWVDEMVLVDTGSRDESPEIARKMGARVIEFPWCDDFSAARNESLRHAQGRWIFWMDTDDTISVENGRRLREIAEQSHDDAVHGFVMQVHCPGPQHDSEPDITVVDQVKLIRNLKDVRFEGRIHEQVIPSIRRCGGEIRWTDIHVTHTHGATTPEARRLKAERDIRLLEMELSDLPDHPFTLFNLGMTFADQGDHNRAVDCLCRSILASQPNDSQVRKAFALLACSWTALERFEQALRAVDAGLALVGHDVELHFRRGIILHRVGRLQDAADAYQAALTARCDVQHFASVDPGIGGFKCRHNLCARLPGNRGP